MHRSLSVLMPQFSGFGEAAYWGIEGCILSGLDESKVPGTDIFEGPLTLPPRVSVSKCRRI